MAIKEENERVTITLTPKQKILLESIMENKGCKTYTKAFAYMCEHYELALYYMHQLIANLDWKEIKPN